MCGIVGLHLREPALYPRLGELVAGMLDQVTERGPDAAGVAVYGDPVMSPPGTASVSVLTGGRPAEELAEAVRDALRASGASQDLAVYDGGQSVVLSRAVDGPAAGEAWLATVRSALPDAVVIGHGAGVAVLKGVGNPRAFSVECGLAGASGWQAVGHTRMATESAVTPTGSHPFSVGPGQCLVHNGSFSNHATIRRELLRAGVAFDSENDTEVGARFVAQQLAQGADLEKALLALRDVFDGFYTVLVSTTDAFAVLRDAIACKPAIVAETSQWVAVASEYRALAGLPGVESAHLFEPEPEEVYLWQR